MKSFDKNYCIGCIKDSDEIPCKLKISKECKLLDGKIKPTLFESNIIKRKPKRFCSKIIEEIQRQIYCDCGCVFATSDYNRDAIFTCPDCGFTDKCIIN